MSTWAIRRAIGKSPTDPAVLERFRHEAWKQQRIVVIRLDEVTDEWLRQALENWAEVRFGQSR